MRLGCAKLARLKEVLLWVDTLGDPTNTVLDGNSHLPAQRDRREFGAAFAKLLWPLVIVSQTFKKENYSVLQFLFSCFFFSVVWQSKLDAI